MLVFLLCSVLESFHKQPLEVDLTQACIVDLNTIVRNDRNWPIIYGVGVSIRTGEIFPATFSDKGPELPLRQARSFTGAQNVLDIYDSSVGMLRIGPFNYDPLRGVDLWLAQNDEFLLQHLSTSPEVEPPSFVVHVSWKRLVLDFEEFTNSLLFLLGPPDPAIYPR